MLLLGLTGSIATGKSTVSTLLTSPPYNLPLIDADLLAHQVISPGTRGYTQILAHFLATTPDLIPAPNSPINRTVLAQRVFGSAPDRVRDRNVLNAITHPLVRGAVLRALVRAYVGGAWAVVLDVPLLFETGAEVVCGGVVVVGAGSVEVQMERLMGRDGLGEEDARRRVESQWGVDEKVRVAEYVFGERAWVVDNSQDLEYLRREVARVMEEVGKGRWGAWRWVWGAPPGVVVLALWVVLGNWWRRRRWEIEMRRVKAKL